MLRLTVCADTLSDFILVDGLYFMFQYFNLIFYQNFKEKHHPLANGLHWHRE